MMGYLEALESAGINIREFVFFGEEYGIWIALLDSNDLIYGEYGSCEWSDKYLSIFEGKIPTEDEDGKYYRNEYLGDDEDGEISKQEFDKLLLRYKLDLKEFGNNLKSNITTVDTLLIEFENEISMEEVSDESITAYNWLLEKKSEIRNEKINNILWDIKQR